MSSYRSEQRRIGADRHDAEELLRYINQHDSITADHLLAASKEAYSGRLTITEHDGCIKLDYCVGQYFPTEYRRAVCAVCASAIWDFLRNNMPAPTYKQHGSATEQPMQTTALYNGMNAGDYLRHAAKRELGAHIARRWFN